MRHQQLIDELADGLEPVKPIAPRHGQWLAVAAAVVTLAIVLVLWGVRPDVEHGMPDPAIAIVSALFVLGAVAGVATVTRMARPSLGSQYAGWRWALAAIAIVPLVALALIAGHHEEAAAHAGDPFGLVCLARGSVASLISMAALFFWVRGGAPASPERAGLLIGASAGCIGAFSLTVQCDFPGFYHAAFWHVAIVAVAIMVGRFVLPRGLRW